ncbi:unnamed protein product [Rotaria sp. Silwood1]|nr:unnamed protein product [Rotaria sp. Silwood1]CAF1621561.1 unnamed protein product [Rotaria sp. Silwood1]
MENSLLVVQSSSSLLTFPTEILHRILDQLNIQDILFSFRYVCTRFYSITKIYNRLTIEISDHQNETPAYRLYRMISPENVTSLILRKIYGNTKSNNIEWFFSFVNIYQFTRLCYVYLESMDENGFRMIIRHLTTLSTFRSLKIFDRRILKNDTIILLSMVIALPSLRKLDLDISSRILDQISWPNDGKFRELKLKKCSYKQWCHIFYHSPNLRIISTEDIDMSNINKTIPSIIIYQQLISLTLNDILFSIDQLEILLTSHPSLVYFNLTAKNISSFQSLRCFSQWEYFIREKLPQLKNFHFKISTQMSYYQDLRGIQSIIAAFRTSFWLEHKRWYVIFQYVINDEGSRLILYSSIDGHVDFGQNFQKGFISYFTSTTKNDDKPNIQNMWNALFNLTDVKQAISFRHFKIPKHYLFDNIIRLGLDIDWYEDWQRSGSFELLSKLISFSQLKEVWFLLSCKQTLQASKINTILEKAPNVHTFGIKNNGSLRGNIDKECAAISSQIEHLIIHSLDTDAMKLILERVEHLAKITFICNWSSSTTWIKMITWLREKEKKFSVTSDHRSLQVWLKENIGKSSEDENMNRID